MLRYLLLLAIVGVNLVLGPGTTLAEHRVALVIGNSSYQFIKELKNPRNDAKDVANALQVLGFDVFRGRDLTNAGFRRILKHFAKALRSADVALLYYAGHGVQINGINYLLPVDAKFESIDDLQSAAFSLRKIQSVMGRRPRVNLLIFDACRDNPLIGKLAQKSGHRVRQGWADLSPPAGTYVSFATAEGDTALDGDGRNSPFTAAFMRHIKTPALDVQLMMRKVRRDVIKATAGQQIPWEKSSLVRTFSFAKLPEAPSLKITANKRRYRKGEKITLSITSNRPCKLTLINVDKKNNSCLLFPNPHLPDRSIEAGQTFLFPPPGPTGTLRLNSPGDETFIAMCNASPTAQRSLRRKTTKVTCSTRGPSENVTRNLLEVATYNPHEQQDRKVDGLKTAPKQTVLSDSVTVTVSE